MQHTRAQSLWVISDTSMLASPCLDWPIRAIISVFTHVTSFGTEPIEGRLYHYNPLNHTSLLLPTRVPHTTHESPHLSLSSSFRSSVFSIGSPWLDRRRTSRKSFQKLRHPCHSIRCSQNQAKYWRIFCQCIPMITISSTNVFLIRLTYYLTDKSNFTDELLRVHR